MSCATCLSGSHGHPRLVDSTFDHILRSLAIGSLGCRVHDWIVTDQSDDCEDNGDYGQEDPACCVARVRDEVTEENGNEEPSYGRQCEHQSGGRPYVGMIDVTYPRRHR